MSFELLSAEEIVAYRREGYIVPKFRFSKGVLGKVQDLATDILADIADLDGVIRRLHFGHGNTAGNITASTRWLSIATHPTLLDILQQLMGPDIVLGTVGHQ